MKKVTIMMSMLLMLIVGMSSCSSDDNSNFHVRNVANSGCKSAATLVRGEGGVLIDMYETIEVKGLDNGYLSFNHENAIFNCEPGELKIQASIEDKVIKIVETEEYPGANCVCPYDLYCEIGPLEGDIEYTIIVFHGDAEYRRFYVKYQKGMEGRFVVEDGWEHHL